MTRLVRIDLVDGLVGIVVDHDGGIGRMIVGAVENAMPAASLVRFVSGAIGIMGRMGSMPGGAARLRAVPFAPGKTQHCQQTDAREPGRDMTQAH